jgi:hypothetical protein
MAQITQTITAYTGDVPNKDSMEADAFDVAAEDFTEWWVDNAAEMNTFATQANLLSASANDLVTALAAANYVGEWDDQVGAATVPTCVSHEDQYWMLLGDIADITASEPAIDNTDWLIYPTGPYTVPKTANYTVLAADCRGHITLTNTGAGGAFVYTLPPVSADYRLRFYVSVAQYLRIDTDGTEKIRWGSEQTAAGGYIRANSIGSYVELSGASGTEWSVVNLQGSWSVDE